MVDSFSTPLDRARALLDDLVAFADARAYAIPSTRYVQIGDIVRDCEATICAVGNLTPDPQYDPVSCVSPRSSTFNLEIIRACAVVYTQSGTTIPSVLEAVSEIGANDGQLLDDFARESIDQWSSANPWSIVWSLAEGGLQVASLQIVIGVP